jgi:kumamolisin
MELLLFAVAALAQAQSLPTRHVRPEVVSGQASLESRMPATQSLRLDLVLPVRDQAGLDKFLQEVGDPSSPSYRHFLTVAEFTARFGPSQEDYDALTRYAASNGLRVVGGSRDGMDLQVEAPVASIETAFHVSMGMYQHPTENRTFYAPDREPTVGLPFALWHISGLDNFSIPHPMLVRKSDYATAHGIDPESVVSYATTGSGPSASYLGSDMRAAYYGGTALTGKGQNLGLFEYAGTDLADLTTYFKNAGQTNNVTITLLSTDGTSTSCVYSKGRNGCDDTEQTLDMTQAIGMAPGLASLVVYIGSSDTAILSAMTTHSPLPTSIGCSWGWTPADPTTDDPYFERMAAQGQSFFAASGDDSTWKSSGNAAAWPADDAHVVSVGGTDLVTASAGGAWASETAWSDSGGGISPDKIAIPAWQQLAGVINSSNKGSTAYRNGPDVSANANFTFYVCADQATCTANEYGGTSFAAPMWAAYMALVNQQAALDGNSPFGFINPNIYQLGGAYFHDIASGTSGSYSAVTGYDLVTGWGSPNGSGLINALASVPTPPNYTVSASPASVSVAEGAKGTSTITTTVSGGFDSAVILSASGQPTGVTVSFSPGFITGAGTSTMTMTVASTAKTGTYTITVDGTSGSTTNTSTVTLKVVR